MTTTKIGREAEKVAGEYLIDKGFKIIAFNWRTRWCEIDIVATKNKRVYFVEVKYRSKSAWGDGMDAITTKKLKQMSFAAEMWVSQNNWDGEYQLCAISMDSDPPKVLDFIIID